MEKNFQEVEKEGSSISMLNETESPKSLSFVQQQIKFVGKYL